MQTPEETLERAQRLVPRHGLAAGADPAPPGARRALRVGLPDPARRRREAARRPGRHRARFHRPARVGRGLPARRRLDRARSDVGPARRRGPPSARVHGRSGQRRAGDRLHRRLRGRVLVRDERDARARGSARHQARTPTRSGRRSTTLGRAGRRRSRAARRAPDAGRRADVRVDRRHGRRRSGTTRRCRRRSASSPRRCCAGSRRASRPAASCTTGRASGIRASRCRAGRSASTGAPTASRCGATAR